MTDHEIDVLSQLCQIRVSGADRVELSQSIDQMLDYLAIMAEYEDDGRSVAGYTQTLRTSSRARGVIAIVRNYEYPAQAAESESDFFVVPNVI